MRTFAPKGNVYGPIMPRYVFKKNLSHGAKIMYSYLCNLAGCNDHCWPSNKTIGDEIGSCENSVKKYMKELADEKLIEVRITQNKRDIYILIPENVECGLNIKLHSDNDISINKIDNQKYTFQLRQNFGSHQSNLDEDQPIFGPQRSTFDERQANFGPPQPIFDEHPSNFGPSQPSFDEHPQILTPQKPIFDGDRPIFDPNQPNFGPINNLNKENKEINNTPPLPPKPARPNGNSFVARSGRPPAAGCVSSFSSDFESIWELYPKKTAKGEAFAEWQALQKANALPDLATIQGAITNLKQSKAWQMEDGRYVPQLARWLNGMGWLDQLSENERQEIARMEAHRRAKEAEAEGKREFMAKREAWLDSIRPQFDEFAAKFTRIVNRAEAFSIWSSLYNAGKAPTAADVPDNNTTEMLVFLLDYRKMVTAEENAQKSKMQEPVSENDPNVPVWRNYTKFLATPREKMEQPANPEVMQSRAV